MIELAAADLILGRRGVVDGRLSESTLPAPSAALAAARAAFAEGVAVSSSSAAQSPPPPPTIVCSFSWVRYSLIFPLFPIMLARRSAVKGRTSLSHMGRHTVVDVTVIEKGQGQDRVMVRVMMRVRVRVGVGVESTFGHCGVGLLHVDVVHVVLPRGHFACDVIAKYKVGEIERELVIVLTG